MVIHDRSVPAGFTIIEILLAITVIAVITGMSYAAYSGFNDRQRVEQSANTFLTQLRVVQKRADSGEKPPNAECQFPNSLIAYRVFAAVGDIQASVEALCRSETGVMAPPISLSPIPLGEHAQFHSTGFSFTFNTLGQTIGVTNTANIVELGAPALSQFQYQIQVDPGGFIRLVKIR